MNGDAQTIDIHIFYVHIKIINSCRSVEVNSHLSLVIIDMGIGDLADDILTSFKVACNYAEIRCLYKRRSRG